jgi:GAF domain-containing protein
MMGRTREGQLVETFVALADTLVVGYDIVDLLQTLVERCAALLDATDAGIILASASSAEKGSAELEVIASTSERTRLIGLMQLSADQGPCVEAYVTGAVVSVSDVRDVAFKWPRFAHDAVELGFASVHAVPLRLRDETLGSLNLFRDRTGVLNDDDATVARALADVATISILQERSIRETDIARQQLQHALSSRIVIEQAKGVVSQTQNVDMQEAFRQIRSRARNTGTNLSEVARMIIDEARTAPR